MKLYYKGKFDGNVDNLPCGKLKEYNNAVKFKEIDDVRKLMFIMNIVASVILIVLGTIYIIRAGNFGEFSWSGMLISVFILFPHEVLHAIFFKEDVYMYIVVGGAFVCGTETMSKKRFILMNMMPNIIFGFVPFIIFLIFPNFTMLGTLGLLAISMGAGDYYNVFNALMQVPKGARCFMEKQNSYWYIPEDNVNK